ncbi:hypothetical protein GCM10027172_22600 [Halomonas garicola]
MAVRAAAWVVVNRHALAPQPERLEMDAGECLQAHARLAGKRGDKRAPGGRYAVKHERGVEVAALGAVFAVGGKAQPGTALDADPLPAVEPRVDKVQRPDHKGRVAVLPGVVIVKAAVANVFVHAGEIGLKRPGALNAVQRINEHHVLSIYIVQTFCTILVEIIEEGAERLQRRALGHGGLRGISEQTMRHREERSDVAISLRCR